MQYCRAILAVCAVFKFMVKKGMQKQECKNLQFGGENLSDHNAWVHGPSG